MKEGEDRQRREGGGKEEVVNHRWELIGGETREVTGTRVEKEKEARTETLFCNGEPPHGHCV